MAIPTKTTPLLTATGNVLISGTSYTATTSWQPIGTIQGSNIGPFDEISWKKPQKYWWKFTHYECPLCGSVDTVRERVNITDEPKPTDPNDRHIDVVIACGYHFT